MDWFLYDNGLRQERANIQRHIFKYKVSLFSTATGKMLKNLFNDIISLTMKATTTGYVVHKFSTNFYKYKRSANMYKVFCLLSK